MNCHDYQAQKTSRRYRREAFCFTRYYLFSPIKCSFANSMSCTSSTVPRYVPELSRTAMYFTSIVRPPFSIQTGTSSRRLFLKSSMIWRTMGSIFGGWQENTSRQWPCGRLNLRSFIEKRLILSASTNVISSGIVFKSAVSCSKVM